MSVPTDHGRVGSRLDAYGQPGRTFFDVFCGPFHKIEALPPVAFFAGDHARRRYDSGSHAEEIVNRRMAQAFVDKRIKAMEKGYWKIQKAGKASKFAGNGSVLRGLRCIPKFIRD